MPAANDARAILNEAEEAVGRNDHASAERLLRQALALQETSVGPRHPEVAKTLNNLAILCEMTGKPADAEACYRRAYEIAKAALPANDPLVVTSRQNLEEFCTAQDFVTERAAVISVPPPAPPSAPPAASSPPPRPAEPPPSPPAARTPSPPVSVAQQRASSPVLESGRSSSRIIIGVLSLAALMLMIVAAWWFAARPSPEPAAAVSQSEPALSPDPPASAPPAPSDPVPEPEPVAPSPTPTAPAPEPSRSTVPSSAPTVVSAQMCRSLSTTGAWECEPATGTQAPGTMYFYTRVASAGDTEVEHRWYRDDRLHQRVQLRIRANQGGFRTYSRTTVGADRTGTWKVELRSSDGQLLHEEVFSVR
jgi:Protein of unknown function (DUF2914)/Tetratricopeptide repeat